MYLINKKILSLTLLILFFACEDPAPIEIINTASQVAEITVVNPDPANYKITGYDSTGIVEEQISEASIISVSGIKNTIENVTIYKGYGEAIFFDKNRPVLNVNNRIIGFSTKDNRAVKFNEQNALVKPLRIRYIENGILNDTLVGIKHTITYRRVFISQNHDFPYNSNINIEVTDDVGISNNLRLKLPDEIFGKVKLISDEKRGTQGLLLSWNESQLSNVLAEGILDEVVIVGGILKTENELVPLIRLQQFTSNRFEIKNSLIKDIIYSDRFDYLVFTFIRKIRKTSSTNRLGDIYFASQSIHNIWVKI
jgi:hypothetical protein